MKSYQNPPANQGDGTVNSLPEILDGYEFLYSDIQPPRELIEGILHQGCKAVLGGNSKAGKTWMQIHIAVCVATGQPWLSFPTTKGRVLYVNFELPAFAFQQRLRAVLTEAGIKLERRMFDVWHLRGRAASYDKLFPRILNQVKTGSYALIILDPIYKLYGDTDENSAGAVAKLLNEIERLAVETGAAILFAAHYAKGNASTKEAIDRVSGSGVFARDPDTILNFTMHEKPEAFTFEATLRNFAPVEPFVVRWEYPLMRRDDSLDPSRLKQAHGRKPENTPADLLKLLPPEGLTNRDWQNEAKQQEGIKERSFYRLRKQLQADGSIHYSKITDKWQPVTKARE